MKFPQISTVLTGKIKNYALYFAEYSLSVQQSDLKVCNPNFKILFERMNSIISTVSFIYVHLLYLKSIQNNSQPRTRVYFRITLHKHSVKRI